MKKLILIVGATAVLSTTAAAATPPFLDPADVNVTNSSLDVNVTNPVLNVRVITDNVSDYVVFYEGYEVPEGKLLVVREASVVCGLKTSDGNTDLGTFTATGVTSSAILRITTPVESCLVEPVPRPGDPGLVCPLQDHYLGTVTTNIIIGFDGDSRPIGPAGAGRRLTALAPAGSKLFGIAQGLQADVSCNLAVGTGQLLEAQ